MYIGLLERTGALDGLDEGLEEGVNVGLVVTGAFVGPGAPVGPEVG